MSTDTYNALCLAFDVFNVVHEFGADADAILAARDSFESLPNADLSVFDTALTFNGDLEAARAALASALDAWKQDGKPGPVQITCSTLASHP